MAYVFTQELQGTLKGKATASQDNYTLKGINSTIESVNDVVSEANKILDIFGKEMAVDENVTMTITKTSEDED